jgi:hypothetical protein
VKKKPLESGEEGREKDARSPPGDIGEGLMACSRAGSLPQGYVFVSSACV